MSIKIKEETVEERRKRIRGKQKHVSQENLEKWK